MAIEAAYTNMENFYVQIESYLLGELGGPELEAFENALQQDAALGRAVERHRNMLRRLEGLRLRRKVGTILKSPGQQAVNASFSPWRIAAALVLLAAAAWFFIGQWTKPPQNQAREASEQVAAPAEDVQPATPSPVAGGDPQKSGPDLPPKPANPGRFIALAQAFYVAPTEDFIRSTNEAPAEKSALQVAGEAFGQKKYRLAADLLADDASLGGDDSGRFLRANARFHAGQFAAAAADFTLLKNSFQFKHEARWNGLLCNIAQGKAQDRDTKALLDAMTSDADFPFQARALALKAGIASKQ